MLDLIVFYLSYSLKKRERERAVHSDPGFVTNNGRDFFFSYVTQLAAHMVAGRSLLSTVLEYKFMESATN
jgi:hypothetical protein